MDQGRSQKFVLEGDKMGTGDRRPPVGSRGRGSAGAKPQKLKTYMLITIAIMC